MSNKFDHSIGVGIITTGREDLFNQCYNALIKLPVYHDYCVVVHNGEQYDRGLLNHHELLTYNDTKCVAINKNRALRALMQKQVHNQNLSHFFLIEDDVVISDKNIFDKYISAARESGIWHLNHCTNELVNTMEYTDDASIDFYSELNSKFTYFHRSVVKHVGYFDERYRSGLSGPDYTYRVGQKKLCPQYGVFADCACNDCITDLDFDKERSILDYKSPDTIKYIQDDTYLFLMKHGVTLHDIKPPEQSELEERLQFLQTNYSKPV